MNVLVLLVQNSAPIVEFLKNNMFLFASAACVACARPPPKMMDDNCSEQTGTIELN